MKNKLSAVILLLSALGFSVAQAQPAKLILEREEGRITFAVDKVDPATSSISWSRNGMEIARQLNLKDPTSGPFSDWEPEIIANSFADEKDLHLVGEDVVFQMLLKAWCQHRPVVLSPDAIWLVICQQVSHCINQNPEDYRAMLVSHDGKKTLEVRTTEELFSGSPDWPKLLAAFSSQIDDYTINDVATTLVADFSTTGIDERIASEVTLMDVVKPYFEYIITYAVCGIPSITLTGTPDDWRKVLEKTRALESLGFGWWVSELEPILEEFVKAAEGNPDYWFWKDIVKKSRPQTIQGPTCGRSSKPQTKFDGWFLKLFPFDNKGRTPEKVTIMQYMLRETVVVPFRYKIVDDAGNVLSENPMELVAGIVGVQEDAQTFALTPKIGWFVRTAEPEAESVAPDGLAGIEATGDSPETDLSIRYWDEGPLSLSDIPRETDVQPDEVYAFNYGLDYTDHEWKVGNTHFSLPTSRTYMNPFVSWVNPAYATPQMLQYFQTIFDYAELFRRQARDDEAADRFMQEMQEATDSGRDSASVQFFSKLVKEELAHTKDPVSDDLIIYPKGWGLGMHGGCEAGLFYGPATKYIDHSFGGGVGFDFVYGRVLLMCDLQRYMYGDLKQEFLHKGELFKAGEWMSGGSVELSLGYIAYDSQWWRVTPFVGAGAGYLSFPRGEDDCKRADDAYGFRALAGIYTDCKFWRQISVPEFMKEPLEEYSVRFKLYVAHTDFPTLGPAWSINFGIGISGIGWLLKK